MTDPLRGELVILRTMDPEEISMAFSKWQQDTEYKRLADLPPPRLNSPKTIKAWFEKELDGQNDTLYWFAIRALEDNRLLGDIVLEVVNWNMQDSFVGIAIGERDFWGKGYGTEAMQLILRFAFTQVNLRRVTLTVFEYNQRGIHSYEKVGFKHEGRQRGRILREGKRWDILFMGILREEWLERNRN
jgi:RimJ/RimL family protein N-acetyltransferase